jgi:hypothetical protein
VTPRPTALVVAQLLVLATLLGVHCGTPQAARAPSLPAASATNDAKALEAANAFAARAMQTLAPYDQRYAEAFSDAPWDLAAGSTAAIDHAVAEGLSVSVWAGRLMPLSSDATRGAVAKLRAEASGIAASKDEQASRVGQRWVKWLAAEFERITSEQQDLSGLPAMVRTAASTMANAMANATASAKAAPSPTEEAALAERLGRLEDKLVSCDPQDAKLIGAALTALSRVLRERPSPNVERATVSLELALGNCASKPRTRSAAAAPEQLAAWTAARTKLRSGVLLGQNMRVSGAELPLKACLESAKPATWVVLHDALPSVGCSYDKDPVLRALLQHELLTMGLWLAGSEAPGASLLSKADAAELSVLVHTYPDRARALATFATTP